jgi:hypothetical protein
MIRAGIAERVGAVHAAGDANRDGASAVRGGDVQRGIADDPDLVGIHGRAEHHAGSLDAAPGQLDAIR